jgi:predicted O-methyltransferase YrrM
MNEKTNQYLHEMLPVESEWVLDLKRQAAADHIPIMDAVSMHFLMQLIRIHKPLSILEIGTAIGYSALRMHEACPESHITTIERDDVRFVQADDNIKRQQKQQQIRVIHGDALEVLHGTADIGAPFDMIFIDAAKGQYQRFFELASPLLAKNGLIISDNVLFRGLVADPGFGTDRLTKIAGKIRSYNTWLTCHPEYTTSIVPVGDGVAISIKE